jgi:hypothetical protein
MRGRTRVHAADFTLPTAWQQVVGEVEERRSRSWATVITEARIVPALRYQFGRHCHTGSEAADGRTRMRVGAPTPIDIARHLAGWGGLIEVVEPETVQTLLAQIGAELNRTVRPVTPGGLPAGAVRLAA